MCSAMEAILADNTATVTATVTASVTESVTKSAKLTEKVETAKRMLECGLDTPLILKVSGLSEENLARVMRGEEVSAA